MLILRRTNGQMMISQGEHYLSDVQNYAKPGRARYHVVHMTGMGIKELTALLTTVLNAVQTGFQTGFATRGN